MDVIPAVDVLGGKVVRLLRGEYSQSTEYGESPAAALRQWADAGAPLVHVVDLAGAKSGVPDTDLWAALAGEGVRFQLGGGIRDTVRAEQAVAAGVQRVVLGTAAVWQPDVLSSTVAAVGTDRVVAAIDVRRGRATGSGWRDDGRVLEVVVADVAEAGVTTVLVTGIERDGTMEGPNLDVMMAVGRIAPHIELLGSGGVGTLEDLCALSAAGAAGAIVGRALYEGQFTYAEAAAHVRV